MILVRLYTKEGKMQVEFTSDDLDEAIGFIDDNIAVYNYIAVIGRQTDLQSKEVIIKS